MGDRCGECGYAYGSVAEADGPGAIAGMARRYRIPLSRFLAGEDGTALLRAHPLPGTWSALEYACHVRDVLEVQCQRIERGLVEDNPVLELMRREERVLELHYNEQDPESVATDIGTNAETLSHLVAQLTQSQLARTVSYPFPEPTERTLSWMVAHTLHEAEHHLLDIGRVMRAARQA